MDIFINVLASLLPLVVGYGIGQWRERQQRKGLSILQEKQMKPQLKMAPMGGVRPT